MGNIMMLGSFADLNGLLHSGSHLDLGMHGLASSNNLRGMASSNDMLLRSGSNLDLGGELFEEELLLLNPSASIMSLDQMALGDALCVCMHMNVYVHIRLCLYLYMYVCVYIYKCVCMHTHYSWTHACLSCRSIRWCMVICIYICLCVCVCLYVYLCTYIYMYTDLLPLDSSTCMLSLDQMVLGDALCVHIYYIHTYIYVCVCICVRTCVYVWCICIYICMYMYVYVCSYILSLNQMVIGSALCIYVYTSIRVGHV